MVKVNKIVFLPKSLRKYIRLHKQNIRRSIISLNKQKEEIKKLYARFLKKEPIKIVQKTARKTRKK